MDVRQILPRLIFEVRNAIVTMLEIPEPATISPEPQRNTRTLARLATCQRKMRKAGILSIAGYTPPPKGENVQQLWIKHGWRPVHNGMQFKAAETEITGEVVAIKRRAKG